MYGEARRYATEKLKLILKPQILGRTADGVPFFGFLVKPSGIYLHKKQKKRYKASIAEIEYKRKKGILSALESGRRVESLTVHLLLARSRNFRNTVLRGRVLGI